MFGKRLVIVDSDARNLRVLDQKLKDAGFEVHTSARTDEAFEAAVSVRPDVVLCEFNGPNVDGLWLCKRLRGEERTGGCGVIFLSRDGSVESKQRALDAGCDEYLHKPIFVREIILHLGNLIARLERRESPSSFSGALSRLSVADLLQLMEASRKTCVVNLRTDPDRSGGFAEGEVEGAILFQAGVVVGAYLGALQGAQAIYRMLLWTDGAFDIEFTPIDSENSVNESTQGLLLEGMRRMDEWTRMLEVVGTPVARLYLSAEAVADLGSQPETMLGLLPLLDGSRSLLAALDQSKLPDETIVFKQLVRLYGEQKLLNVDEAVPLTEPKAARPQPIRADGASDADNGEDSPESWWREMMKLV